MFNVCKVKYAMQYVLSTHHALSMVALTYDMSIPPVSPNLNGILLKTIVLFDFLVVKSAKWGTKSPHKQF